MYYYQVVGRLKAKMKSSARELKEVQQDQYLKHSSLSNKINQNVYYFSWTGHKFIENSTILLESSTILLAKKLQNRRSTILYKSILS